MAGKHRAESTKPDVASLERWSDWANLGASVGQYPAHKAAHRAPSWWRAIWGRLSVVPRRAAGRV